MLIIKDRKHLALYMLPLIIHNDSLRENGFTYDDFKKIIKDGYKNKIFAFANRFDEKDLQKFIDDLTELKVLKTKKKKLFFSKLKKDKQGGFIIMIPEKFI